MRKLVVPMSGHSKWHNIQGRKGKQDAKRSASYSKFSKLISVASRAGGDPNANFGLRLAIDRAKEVGVPKDNIERAIKRGTGELAGAQIEEILYECYGPGGVAILVKALTDNKNRTVSDLKHLFNEYGGSMAGAGSVLWMFQQFGIVEVKDQKTKISAKGGSAFGGKNRDEFELLLIDSGAENFEDVDEDLIVRTKVENLQKVLNKLKELGIEFEESRLEWIAKDQVQVTPEIEEKIDKLLEKISDHDDVEDFFTNVG